MADEKFIIPIEAIENDFSDFLVLQNNSRIIFSGPFGIGKTYFLDKFFTARADQYYPVFLRPVNYSILSNEDVFMLVKYDIVTQMIKDIDIEKEFEFSKLEYSMNFLNFNKYLILKNVLKQIPKLKQGVEITEEFEKLIETYRVGWKQINKPENEKIIDGFYNANENHFLLEFDNISKFISNQLNEIAIKKGKEGKPLQKVLVIDDLDRLDPEHIFRLFNVFSAHFDLEHYQLSEKDKEDDNNDNKDEKKLENKFGFDKIIFVCDIENIRKIFAHKYGEGVDFTGYIDKFYSKQIYYFQYQDVFQEYIQKYAKQFLNDISFQLYDKVEGIFNLILQIIFEGNQLSIRDIQKFDQIQLFEILTQGRKIKKFEISLDKIGAQHHTYIEYYPICLSIFILSKVFGNSSLFLRKLNNAVPVFVTKTNDLEYETGNYLRFMPQIILFEDYKNHKFEINPEKRFRYQFQFEGDSSLEYNVFIKSDNNFIEKEYPIYGINITQKDTSFSKGSFIKKLVEAVNIIVNNGLIKV